MRISLKLAASFAVMATLVGVVGYWSGAVQTHVEREVERLSRSAMVSVVDAADMGDALSAAHITVHELLQQWNAGRPGAPQDEEVRRLMRRHRDRIETSFVAFRRSLERSRLSQESLLQDPDFQAAIGESGKQRLLALDRLTALCDEYGSRSDEVLELIETDARAANTLFESQVGPHYHDRILPLILKLRQDGEADFTRGVRSVERSIAEAKTRRQAITLVSLAIAIGLGLLVAWSIGRPLTTLTQATSQIAEGRLDTRVDLRSYDEVGTLAESFNRMAASLQSKTVAKSYVDNIIGSMRDMLVVTDVRLGIRRVNLAASREMDFAEGELLGQPLSRIWGEPTDFPEDASALVARQGGTWEGCWKTQGLQVVPVSCTVSPLHDDQGQIQGVVCVATNIAERKAAEQQLRASLQEKDVLLKEVHHRVKNNLQIISSLLNLQTQAAATPEAARALRESQGRIHSMALIHQQLYRSENLASIDFAEYVKELTMHLARSTGAAARGVAVHVEVEAGPLPIDLAIPCGMIVNELVTNAMEHAFPDRPGGEIRVGFRNLEGASELHVSDNGVGGVSADQDPAAGSALGLKVVRALTDQLGGTLRCEANGGMRFIIQFEAVKNPGHPS